MQASIVPLCTNLESRYVEVLKDAFRAMSSRDYPVDWQDLPAQLVAALDTQDFGVIVAVLTLMEGLMGRYRHKEVDDPLIEDLQFTLKFVEQPLLDLTGATRGLVADNPNNREILEAAFAALDLLLQIFLSVTWHDLPPFFEDTFSQWTEVRRGVGVWRGWWAGNPWP